MSVLVMNSLGGRNNMMMLIRSFIAFNNFFIVGSMDVLSKHGVIKALPFVLGGSGSQNE